MALMLCLPFLASVTGSLFPHHLRVFIAPAMKLFASTLQPCIKCLPSLAPSLSPAVA